ncbi:hypothetical protein HY570_00410 [Candidatus Micrarchaeota archaeon]|nr:hypothetical protein [Candidatus Micrarchaeota archaeon]
MLFASFAVANPFSELYTTAYNDGNLFVEKNVLIVCSNQLSIITLTITAVCNTSVNIALSNIGIEPLLDLNTSEKVGKINKTISLPQAILNESALVSNSIGTIATGKIIFSESPVKEDSRYVWNIGILSPGERRVINYSVDAYLDVEKTEDKPELGYTLPGVKFLLSDGKVGEVVSVKVLSTQGGVPLPNTTIEVITPSNDKVMYRTDRFGTVEFTAKEAGLYKYAVSNRSLEGTRSNFIAEINEGIIDKPPVAAALQDSSFENMVRKYLPGITAAVVILILIVIGASYFFLRPGKEEVVQPPKGLVQEAAKEFEEKRQRTGEKPKVTIAKRRVDEEAEEEPEEEAETRELETEEAGTEGLNEKDYEDQLRKLIEEAQKFRKQKKEEDEESEEEEPRKQRSQPSRKPASKKKKR